MTTQSANPICNTSVAMLLLAILGSSLCLGKDVNVFLQTKWKLASPYLEFAEYLHEYSLSAYEEYLYWVAG